VSNTSFHIKPGRGDSKITKSHLLVDQSSRLRSNPGSPLAPPLANAP